MRKLLLVSFLFLYIFGNSQYFGTSFLSNSLFGSTDGRKLEGYGFSEDFFYQSRTNQTMGFLVALSYNYFNYKAKDYYSKGNHLVGYRGNGIGIKAGIPLKLPVDSLKKMSFYFTPYLTYSLSEKLPTQRINVWDVGVSLNGMYAKYNYCFYLGILANIISMKNDFGNGIGLWCGFGFKSFKQVKRPPKKSASLF